MSIRLMSQVWEDSPLEGSALLIELSLADHADEHGKCWPSFKTLARYARCSEEWVRKTIRELESTGRLVIEEHGGGRNKPNVYRLNPQLNTPNTVAGIETKPPTATEKPPTPVGETPNFARIDPSRTINIEPPVEPTRRNIFVLYDNYMGKPSVTGAMRDVLIQAEEDYPDECITHCFLAAARSSDGRRSWSYVESILKRHQSEGCSERKPVGRNAVAAQAPVDALTAIYAAYPSIKQWADLDPGAGDGGLAPVDGDDDPQRLEVRR